MITRASVRWASDRMTENPYAAPQTPVDDRGQRDPDKPSAGVRFVWAASCAFPLFMVLILIFLPRGGWLMGALGSMMFSAFAGIIAMCIPVKPKAAFIIPGVAIAFYCAYLLGT